MVPHSSTLARKIPWTEEPGGLQSMGSWRVRHDFTFTFTFHFQALEKEMATHSSVLAWRIPGMGGPDGLLSMGLHRVGHDWSDLAAAAAIIIQPFSSQQLSWFQTIDHFWGLGSSYKWNYKIHSFISDCVYNIQIAANSYSSYIFTAI